MYGSLRNEHETVGDFIRDDFRKIMEQQGYLCFWCGVPICEKSLDPKCEAEPDHLLPRSKGGADFYWNIVAACAACNDLRGSKMPGEFLRERWAFAQLVGTSGEFRTGIALSSGTIPYKKKRLTPNFTDPEIDDDGNEIVSHIEASPSAVSAVRYLSTALRMEKTDRQKRLEELRAQLSTLYRRELLRAGQMEFNFNPPKPVVGALLATEAQAMTVSGGIAIDARRKA